MIWTLKYARDGWSIEEGLAKGREPADWYRNEPLLEPGTEWWIETFHELSSCRSQGFGSLGPIPWSVIVDFGDRCGFDQQMTDVLVTIIRQLDITYLEWKAEEAKTKRTKPAPPPNIVPKRGRI